MKHINLIIKHLKMKTKINFKKLALSLLLIPIAISCDDLNDTYPELVGNEESGILLMREEEKMARDVYDVLYDKWNIIAFQNIWSSENKHYESMGSLIAAYNLNDPSTGLPGTFTNQAITDLYNQLIQNGQLSATEALKTGAFIEEYDILDLERLIAETSNPELITVYDNLLRGSRNHLRSFVSNLKTYSVDYHPQLLDELSFNEIILSPMERGNE